MRKKNKYIMTKKQRYLDGVDYIHDLYSKWLDRLKDCKTADEKAKQSMYLLDALEMGRTWYFRELCKKGKDE